MNLWWRCLIADGQLSSIKFEPTFSASCACQLSFCFVFKRMSFILSNATSKSSPHCTGLLGVPLLAEDYDNWFVANILFQHGL